MAFKQIMVFSSVLAAAEQQFSRTNLWSMVSIVDSLHCFLFQFIKNGSAAMQIDCVVYTNEGQSPCVLKNIFCRKGATHRTEIERLFLATRSFNTKLVQFLLPYVIFSNVHMYFCMGNIFHMHGCAPKTVLCAQNLVYRKLLWRSDKHVIMQTPWVTCQIVIWRVIERF